MKKLSEIFGPPQTPDEMEKCIFARFDLERPKYIPTEARKLIWEMAIRLNIANPKLVPAATATGAPRKWPISSELVALWARIELRLLATKRTTKKSTVYMDVKEEYGYTESAKRLGNLYTTARQDIFVRIYLDTIKYDGMTKQEKIEFLNKVAAWNY